MPLRACYAALAMQAAMRGYTETVRRTHGLTLRIRVGLNSGEVVVRAIGNDLHMDYSAVGPTTHLAARMEQLAAPGSIMLTAATLRLVEGLVRVHDVGPVPVKGLTEPIAVFELTGASATRRRLEASVARGPTRFVGRETEIEALRHALEQARSRARASGAWSLGGKRCRQERSRSCFCIPTATRKAVVLDRSRRPMEKPSYIPVSWLRPGVRCHRRRSRAEPRSGPNVRAPHPTLRTPPFRRSQNYDRLLCRPSSSQPVPGSRS